MAEQEEVPKDLAKLWTRVESAVSEIKGEIARLTDSLFGRDGTNGINGRTKALEARVGELKDIVEETAAWGKHLWEVDRPADCIGKAALDAYIETKRKEAEEVKKARVALYAALGAALISAASAFAVASLNRQTQLEIAMISQQIKAQQIEVRK